jgi:hypothetical protein
LNESERKQGVLIELLKEIKHKHPEVAELISRGLTRATGQVETVAIERESVVDAEVVESD